MTTTMGWRRSTAKLILSLSRSCGFGKTLTDAGDGEKKKILATKLFEVLQRIAIDLESRLLIPSRCSWRVAQDVS